MNIGQNRFLVSSRKQLQLIHDIGNERIFSGLAVRPAVLLSGTGKPHVPLELLIYAL